MGTSDPRFESSAPFLNFLKKGYTYSYGAHAEFNDSGYPIGALTADRHMAVFLTETGTDYTGNWVLKWAGSGPLQLQASASPFGINVVSGGSFVSGGTSSNMNTTGSNGRIVFNFAGAQVSCTLAMRTGSFSGFGGVVLVREDQEAALDGGAIFNPLFMAKYSALNPKTVRPLGWHNVNQGHNVGHWGYRGQPSDINWYTKICSGAWVGTVAGTNTYTCGASPDATALTHLMAVQGKITNANTGACTLNFNGTGAKSIFKDFSAVSGAGAVSAGLATFVYDSELNAWCYYANAFTTRFPLEMEVAFANELGCAMWHQFSHFDTDACVASKIAYIRDNLTPGLVCYLEFSNEVWNFGQAFAQTYYSSAKGQALGFANSGAAFLSWYGKRFVEIMTIATSTWGPRSSSELVRVMAFQEYGDVSAVDNYRLKGIDLGAYGMDTAPDRPVDWCDSLSYATYYCGAQTHAGDGNYANTMTGLLDAADDYDSGTPSLMEDALDWLDSDVRAGTRNGSAGSQCLLAHTAKYAAWEAKAALYGKNVECYEGGFECKAPSTSRLTALGHSTAYSAKITTLINAYKHDARFQTLVTDQINQFLAEPHSVSASWLNGAGPNQWALFEDDEVYSASFKSYDALVALGA